MDAVAVAQPVESPHHGSTPFSPSASTPHTVGEVPTLRKSKSMRTRPNEMLEMQEAVPRLPLNDTMRPRELQPRSSKMSLFHLFSKPKVEKLRGYTEPGSQHLALPIMGKSKSTAVSENDLSTRRSNTLREPSVPRPTSSKSQHTVPSARLTMKEPVPPLPQDRKSTPFSPPPLFQAYPQATKHGVLEIPTALPDTKVHKSKSQRSAPVQTISVETVRKIFVLITSGYLLQYAHDGPSDRQPEKILELGTDSAAFVCDLLPGKHYVLQVSHALNRQGTVIYSSTSFLAKLGLRGNTSRRMTSNQLLVLPTAEEMDSWMVAIRHEIEVQGGKKLHTEAAVAAFGPKKQQVTTDLRKAPSTSHRYQVKRDPSKVSSIASPSEKDSFPTPLTPTVKLDDDSIETATIDDIEEEASTIGNDSQARRTRAISDAPSAGSSTAQSIEQQQLERIRESIRMSHASSPTTGLTSRTSSPTSSQPSDGPAKGILDAGHDATGPNAPYRALSSYAVAKRRSLAPLILSSREEPSTEALHSNSSSTQAHDVKQLESPIHSPINRDHSFHANTLPSPHKRLSLAVSAPDLKAAAQTKRRHDSKLQSPSAAGVNERPESVLGELPSPAAWSGKTSPNLRNSTFLLASNTEAATSQAVRRPSSQTRMRSTNTNRQAGGHSASFSLPLKINAPDQPSARSVKRASQAMDQAPVASPVPVVHTLTAKVDLTTRTTISAAHIPPRTSSTIGPFGVENLTKTSRDPNARLSLFPTQPLAFPPMGQNERMRRSPSSPALPLHSDLPQAAGSALKRPTSMQVRTSHAPFLSSVRNSTQGVPMAPIRPGTTIPIRSLKPSRASMMMTHPAAYTPAQDPFYEAKLASVALAAEAGDEPSPLPMHHPSLAFPLMQSSPALSSRRTSRIKSGTLLELGIPIAGLGPPAPPPQAPLPQIPTVGKTPSPTNDANPFGGTFLENGSPPRPRLELETAAS